MHILLSLPNLYTLRIKPLQKGLIYAILCKPFGHFEPFWPFKLLINMGILADIFGGRKSSLSQKEYYLSKQEIDDLVSAVKIKSLDGKEEKLVEKALDDRRRGDGKIALSQIDEALRKLENLHKMSQYDRKALNKIFQEYFNKKA